MSFRKRWYTIEIINYPNPRRRSLIHRNIRIDTLLRYSIMVWTFWKVTSNFFRIFFIVLGTFCGVFRRQALDRGAVLLSCNKIATGRLNWMCVSCICTKIFNIIYFNDFCSIVVIMVQWLLQMKSHQNKVVIQCRSKIHIQKIRKTRPVKKVGS